MDKVTSQDVREAVINCFYNAHCADTGLNEDESVGRSYCASIVKKAFADQGADFEHPTKEGILKVVGTLAEFSKNFRSQEVIAKHQQEIQDLISKMTE